jgi:shikimate kinase
MNVVSIIGMSNSGKSYYSARLAKELGVVWFNIDGMIQRKLKDELGGASIADWLGVPEEKSYRTRADRYLALESEALMETLDCIPAIGDLPAIVDTTGSLVYLSSRILERLSLETRVVYLETPCGKSYEQSEGEFDIAKPVIWPPTYSKQYNSVRTSRDRVNRLKALFKEREASYRALARTTIDAKSLIAEPNVESIYRSLQFCD